MFFKTKFNQFIKRLFLEGAQVLNFKLQNSEKLQTTNFKIQKKSKIQISNGFKFFGFVI